MKNNSIGATALLTVFVLTPTSVGANTFMDTAHITSIEDVYQTHTIREPYQDCYIKEFYQVQSDGSYTNEIFGGILGGAIGNQFGGGSGRDAMTVAGTLLGASIANDNERKNTNKGKLMTKEVCETKYTTTQQKRLNHYRVTYEYQDRTFSFKTKHKPNTDTLDVKVGVFPR